MQSHFHFELWMAAQKMWYPDISPNPNTHSPPPIPSFLRQYSIQINEMNQNDKHIRMLEQ